MNDFLMLANSRKMIKKKSSSATPDDTIDVLLKTCKLSLKQMGDDIKQSDFPEFFELYMSNMWTAYANYKKSHLQ